MRAVLRFLFNKLGLLELGQDLFLKYLSFKQKFAVKIILPLFSWNGFLSSLYYTFFSRAFYNTHKAILSGKIQHLNKLFSSRPNEYLLANYIHALEKGLTMKDRKEIFALSYIKKTVTAYETVVKTESTISKERIKWFHDILTLYFESAGNHKVIKEAKAQFQSIPALPFETSVQTVPVVRKQGIKSTISYDEFYKLNQQRRSVRWFKKAKVPHELIDKAIAASLFSPSACNRQPFRFMVFDSEEYLSKLKDLPSGTKGFSDNIPMLIAVVGYTDAYENERDKNVFVIDASLASMNFMLALETLGLSSCSLNWPDINSNEKKLRKVLSLPITERIIMFIAVGFPEEEGFVPSSVKKSLETVRTYNMNQ